MPDDLEALVKERAYPSRSNAIQEAVAEKLRRIGTERLARECAKLDSAQEQEIAEEGMDWEVRYEDYPRSDSVDGWVGLGRRT